MARIVLISGANRGIGLGLTGYFLAKGDTVIATTRNPDKSKELQDLAKAHGGKCFIEALDVASDLSVKGLALKVNEFGRLDVLINNAGVMKDSQVGFEELPLQLVVDTFQTNTVGAMRMTQALLGLLQKSTNPTVVNITSKMGSIQDNTGGGYYAYRISKTALNMFNKSFAHDHPSITSVVFHPGWVQTDMGGGQAPTKVQESVTGMGKQIDKFTKDDSGKFLDFRGQEIPW